MIEISSSVIVEFIMIEAPPGSSEIQIGSGPLPREITAGGNIPQSYKMPAPDNQVVRERTSFFIKLSTIVKEMLSGRSDEHTEVHREFMKIAAEQELPGRIAMEPNEHGGYDIFWIKPTTGDSSDLTNHVGRKILLHQILPGDKKISSEKILTIISQLVIPRTNEPDYRFEQP